VGKSIKRVIDDARTILLQIWASITAIAVASRRDAAIILTKYTFSFDL
jgi:hypothetical protein